MPLNTKVEYRSYMKKEVEVQTFEVQTRLIFMTLFAIFTA